MVGQDEMMSSALMNQVWLDEFQTPEPGWTQFVEVTERLYRFAFDHELVGLAAAAAKMVSRVMDENQGFSEKSLERAEEFALELGDGPPLQDGRARILTHMGRDHEALELWRAALPQWNVEHIDVNVGIGFREAAMAAGRLGLWEEAGALFSDGAKRLEDESVRTFRVGMTVDEGFASWKSGDNQHALECFKSGLEELEAMQTEVDSDPVYSLQRRIGHTGMWVSSQCAGQSVPEDYSEPTPGLCSDLEPLKGEKGKGTPIDYIFASYVDFEEACNLGEALFVQYGDRGTGSEHVAVRVGFLERAFRWRLEKVESDGLLEGIVELARCLVITREQMSKAAGKPEEAIVNDEEPELSSAEFELVRVYMLIGMFSFVARGKVTNGLVSSWRNEAERLNVTQGLDDWVDLVEGLFVAGRIDAEECTKVRDGSWIDQCLASRVARCLVITREQMSKAAGKPEEAIVNDEEPELSSAEFELVRVYMLIGMFSFVARGKVTNGLVSSWRNEAERLNVTQGLDDWVDLVEGLFVAGRIDAEECTKVRDGSWIDQCLASLCWASGEEIDPSR